jgi:hypothetical protein
VAELAALETSSAAALKGSMERDATERFGICNSLRQEAPRPNRGYQTKSLITIAIGISTAMPFGTISTEVISFQSAITVFVSDDLRH